MIISERIFKILKEKQISQKTFSQETGIAQSTISDWKRKKTNPASDKIMLICNVLGVTPYELLSGTDTTLKKESDFIMVPKNSQDYRLLEEFQALENKEQGKLLGYLQALKEN
jgi:transcriptional regulator with XRE-family HTH domain